MNKIFKQTVIFATLMVAGIFAVQLLLAITNILLALASSIADLSKLVPGTTNKFVMVQSILQWTTLTGLIYVLYLILTYIGSVMLKGATVAKMIKTSARAPFKSLGNTAKGGTNFLRGLRHLNQNELRSFAMRKSLLGGGGRRGGKLINKALRGKDDLDMMKSIMDRGADGKKRKDNLNKLKEKGLTPKDSRKEANSLIGKKNAAKLANLGLDSYLLNQLGDDDKRHALHIADDDSRSLADKRDAIKNLRLNNLKNQRDNSNSTMSDEALEKFADRKHRAALAHGQRLDSHVNSAKESLERNDVKVYDDEGREMNAIDYINAHDNSAVRTSDKFRNAHKSTLDSYATRGVAGAATAMYALDISRTNEENRNSTVNGSLNPAYTQPVASDEEKKTDHAARVHGQVPIDSEVAKDHADKAAKDMENINASETGFKSTGEKPVKEDKISRDDKGNAISSFIEKQDDYVHAAEVINSGSPYGNILPRSLTDDFDPEKMTEKNIAAATEDNLATYAAGAYRPDVISGRNDDASYSGIDNAFATKPLDASTFYGYEGNVNTSIGQQAMDANITGTDSPAEDISENSHDSFQSRVSTLGNAAAAGVGASMANNDGLDDTFRDDNREDDTYRQQPQSQDRESSAIDSAFNGESSYQGNQPAQRVSSQGYAQQNLNNETPQQPYGSVSPQTENNNDYSAQHRAQEDQRRQQEVDDRQRMHDEEMQRQREDRLNRRYQEDQRRQEDSARREEDMHRRHQDDMERRARDIQQERMNQRDTFDGIDSAFNGNAQAAPASGSHSASRSNFDTFNNAWTGASGAAGAMGMAHAINGLVNNLGNRDNIEFEMSRQSQQELDRMLRQYKDDLERGAVSSMDKAESRIKNIANYAAGSLSESARRTKYNNKAESMDAERRVNDAKDSLNDSLTDMLNRISQQTLNRKADAEEEERRKNGTSAIKDEGNRGRGRRG